MASDDNDGEYVDSGQKHNDDNNDNDVIESEESSNQSHDGTDWQEATRHQKRWGPGDDQMLLLSADAQGVVDWNVVGPTMDPPVTGQAIKQHIKKLWKARHAAGLPVAPPPGPDTKSSRRPDGTIPCASLLPQASDGKRRKQVVDALVQSLVRGLPQVPQNSAPAVAPQVPQTSVPAVAPQVPQTSAPAAAPQAVVQGSSGLFTPTPESERSRLLPPFVTPTGVYRSTAPGPAPQQPPVSNNAVDPLGAGRAASSANRFVTPKQKRAPKNASTSQTKTKKLTKKQLEEKAAAEAQAERARQSRYRMLLAELESFAAVTRANIPTRQDAMGTEYVQPPYNADRYTAMPVEQRQHEDLLELAIRNHVPINDRRLLVQAERAGVIPTFARDIMQQIQVEQQGAAASTAALNQMLGTAGSGANNVPTVATSGIRGTADSGPNNVPTVATDGVRGTADSGPNNVSTVATDGVRGIAVSGPGNAPTAPTDSGHGMANFGRAIIPAIGTDFGRGMADFSRGNVPAVATDGGRRTANFGSDNTLALNAADSTLRPSNFGPNSRPTLDFTLYPDSPDDSIATYRDDRPLFRSWNSLNSSNYRGLPLGGERALAFNHGSARQFTGNAWSPAQRLNTLRHPAAPATASSLPGIPDPFSGPVEPAVGNARSNAQSIRTVHPTSVVRDAFGVTTTIHNPQQIAELYRNYWPAMSPTKSGRRNTRAAPRQ